MSEHEKRAAVEVAFNKLHVAGEIACMAEPGVRASIESELARLPPARTITEEMVIGCALSRDPTALAVIALHLQRALAASKQEDR